MCGRVTLTLDKQTVMDILGDVFDIKNQPSLIDLPNYNLAPMQNILSILEHHHENRAGYLQWGFNTEVGPMINARSESIDRKDSFKSSFASKRCILLADSFYEWKREPKLKRPFRFQISNQPLIPFAGIYTSIIKSDGTKSHSCAILTCESNELMSKIHHRMPVILMPNHLQQWLSPASSQKELKALLTPYSEKLMSCYEVSPFVNSVHNNSVKCISPLSTQESLDIY